MVLYFLVGIEILKQRQFFKSLDNEFVPIDNISFNNGAVEGNGQSTIHTSNQQEGKELVFENSISAESSSRQTPADSIAFDHQPPRRPPVSFGQYILMPVMFFFLLLMIWVAPTINRVASFINPNFVSYPLYLAVGSMGSLRGFCNAVVFIIVGMKERKRRKRMRN